MIVTRKRFYFRLVKMNTSTGDLKQCDNWIRSGVALQRCVIPALLSVLHNTNNDPSYTGLPQDETKLFQCLCLFKKREEKNVKKVVRSDQWAVLYPASGKTDSKTFDVTLLVIVIRYETNLPAMKGGWGIKNPDANDFSKDAFCIAARELRNLIIHSSIKSFEPVKEFDNVWSKLEKLLNGLNFDDMTSFQTLKHCTLDHTLSQAVSALQIKQSDMETSVISKDLKIAEQFETIKQQQQEEIQTVLDIIKTISCEITVEVETNISGTILLLKEYINVLVAYSNLSRIGNLQFFLLFFHLIDG